VLFQQVALVLRARFVLSMVGEDVGNRGGCHGHPSCRSGSGAGVACATGHRGRRREPRGIIERLQFVWRPPLRGLIQLLRLVVQRSLVALAIARFLRVLVARIIVRGIEFVAPRRFVGTVERQFIG
jgi:hypothetical protein